jgi:hypothetical protein
MTNPNAAWWAKIRRAQTHVATLGALAAEFRDSEPYTLTPEPGIHPNEVAYRLRIDRDVPAEISTVVGDIVHNLRSALESLAYVLADESMDRWLTNREEQVTGFPWCANETDFDLFFGIGIAENDSDDAPRVRGSIYAAEARNALRAVQPFSRADSGNLPSRVAHEDFMRSAIRAAESAEQHRQAPPAECRGCRDVA